MLDTVKTPSSFDESAFGINRRDLEYAHAGALLTRTRGLLVKLGASARGIRLSLNSIFDPSGIGQDEGLLAIACRTPCGRTAAQFLWDSAANELLCVSNHGRILGPVCMPVADWARARAMAEKWAADLEILPPDAELEPVGDLRGTVWTVEWRSPRQITELHIDALRGQLMEARRYVADKAPPLSVQ